MHIHKEELDSFTNRTLETQDIIAFLEHLDTCDFCLEQMIQEEAQNCIQAPAYMKRQIIKRAQSPEIQASRAARMTSQKMYSFTRHLQTAFGILAALFLLFSCGNIQFPILHQDVPIQQEHHTEVPEHRNHLYHFTKGIGREISKSTDRLTKYLHEFPNIIMNGGK